MSNVSSPRTFFRRCLLLLRPLFPSLPLSLLPSPEAIAFFFFFFFFFFHFSLFSFLVGRSHLLHLLLPHFPGKKEGKVISSQVPIPHPRENIPRPTQPFSFFITLGRKSSNFAPSSSPLENVGKSGLMVSSSLAPFFVVFFFFFSAFSLSRSLCFLLLLSN